MPGNNALGFSAFYPSNHLVEEGAARGFCAIFLSIAVNDVKFSEAFADLAFLRWYRENLSILIVR